MALGTDGGYLSTTQVDLDGQSNFEIECRVSKASGVNSFFYGLVWGMKDDNNFFDLAITGDGRLAVTKKEDGVFHDYVDARLINPYINQGDATNTLAIRKDGNRLEFFLNGHSVYEMQAAPFFGEKIGFVIYNRMQIAFDYLIVKTAKS